MTKITKMLETKNVEGYAVEAILKSGDTVKFLDQEGWAYDKWLLNGEILGTDKVEIRSSIMNEVYPLISDYPLNKIINGTEEQYFSWCAKQ